MPLNQRTQGHPVFVLYASQGASLKPLTLSWSTRFPSSPPRAPAPAPAPRRLAGATESVQSGSRRGAVRQQLEGDLVG